MLTYLGQVTGRQEPLDLSEMCGKSLPALAAGLPDHVELQTELPTPGPVITANAKQLQQVLVNLVTNAWESVGVGHPSTIRLTTRTVSPEAIPLDRRFPVNWQPEAGAYGCLEVWDSGCGMSEEDLDELFSPFFSTKFTGRGLGLPMVLGIVQAHGGAITVDSRLGEGSVFRVFLPSSAEQVPVEPVPAVRTTETPAAGTVLLVDDEEIVVNITRMMLAKLGFTVLCAGNGQEALELFASPSCRYRDTVRCQYYPRLRQAM